MAIRRPPSTFSDELTASDLAANSVTASELADNAVDTAAVADNAINTAKIATNAVTASEIAANAVGESELSVDYTAQSVPHIIPGVLYPAYNNKKLDGTDLVASTTGPGGSTVASSKYGTVQGDGKMYYYTYIKGSKPIKDPRIGAHFGSQRHKAKSIQLLEQETANGTGKNVYSIDGREWMRLNATYSTGLNWNISWGNFIEMQTANDFIEITGYFNDVNIILLPYTTLRHFTWSLDGGSSTVVTDTRKSVNTPLGIDRYVDAGSLYNIGLGATLGIHTLRILNNDASNAGQGFHFWGAELIAQDTTSTATKSKIQIPSQDVVSYGKKFNVSGTPHYNPFAQSQTGADVTINSSTTNTAKLADGWSGTGATYYSSELDTATSLGLSAWESGGDFYRPVNGGRVVWWVNSSGDLKCSVNMMPPAGTALGGVTSGHNVPTGTHNWATKYQPALHSTTIDNSQSELAKTFHFREFGNGSANGSGSFKDMSTLDSNNSANGISGGKAFVMDDGLTSLAGVLTSENANGYGVYPVGTGEILSLTFIGTGLSYYDENDEVGETLVQNLPYGTHIFQFTRDGTIENSPAKIDGVTVKTEWMRFNEFSFHQPKMPPIPEDACVIADYMLMADLVKQTAATAGHISKGTRFVSSSRDFLYNAAGAFTVEFNHPAQGTGGMNLNRDANDAAAKAELPFFGTNFISEGYTGRFVSKLNGSALSNVSELTGGWVSKKVGDGTTLGLHKASVNPETNNLLFFASMAIATPIHTSSHYQTFETPFLHELIGGDRNMEQTNLVVSPDGKTWDEVTRDTSYMGNQCISTASPTDAQVQDKHPRIHTRWRGTEAKTSNWRVKTWLNKDFAIAYDRVICLKDGNYRFQYTFRVTSSVGAAGTFGIILNDANTANASVTSHIFKGYHSDANQVMTLTGNYYLRRGDVISWQGPCSDTTQDTVQIERVK